MLWFSALISCGRLMPMTFACKAQLLTELSDLILNTLMEGGFCTQWNIDSRFCAFWIISFFVWRFVAYVSHFFSRRAIYALFRTFFRDQMLCGLKSGTVRPWDARFLGTGKTCVAQNLCNLSYLIRQRQEIQKTVQHKVFTTYIRASQNFLDPIQKHALSRSVQLEAVYLEALL